MAKFLLYGLFSFFMGVQVCFAGGRNIEGSEDSVATFADVLPEFVTKPKLEFPSIALEAGVVGKIWIKALVGKDGHVKKTVIQKREPEIAYLFDEQARRWAMQCVFTPALYEGRPVAVWISVPLNFRIHDFQPPSCLDIPHPEYPTEALEQGLEGWVGIAILVDEMGTTIGSRALIIAREPMTSRAFDDAAIDAVKKTRFKPAEGSRGMTKGWALVKVDFSLPED